MWMAVMMERCFWRLQSLDQYSCVLCGHDALLTAVWCVFSYPLSLGPAWNSLSFHESLQSKSFGLSSGVRGSQFILFVFHDYLVRLLPDKQLLRSSADKPFSGAPHLITRWTSLLYRQWTMNPLAVLHCTVQKIAWSQWQPKAVEK